MLSQSSRISFQSIRYIIPTFVLMLTDDKRVVESKLSINIKNKKKTKRTENELVTIPMFN